MVEILLFYKFVNIENPQSFMKGHLKYCKSLGVFGKVLVGEEGINGSISGTKVQVEKYKSYLRSDSRFADMVFKQETGDFHPFRRMVVRVRKEIIALGKKVNLANTGKYIEPSEFMEIAKDKDVVILDTRNDYEWKVGKFKDALTLDIGTFKEFPKAVENLGHLKKKKVVMYCTGGIRCEKASAFMKEQGFEDVSQLHGGIITYCQQKPDTLWEGACFVFDNRLVSNVGNKSSPITNCVHCGVKCDLCSNCRNIKCNDYVISCPKCNDDFQGCCSKECFETYKKSWH